jgi:DNA polymerase-3 subunit beta
MQFTIKTNELKALLICAGKKDIRYYLNGIYFESSPNGLIAVATDGHRLLAINLPNEHHDNVSAIVPRALIEIAVKTKMPEINISIENDIATLSSAGQSTSGSLTEGKFPDYRRVIPERASGERTADFNNEYLVDFDKIGKLLQGGELARVVQNGLSSAMVHFSDDNAIGVVMPMRKEAIEGASYRPTWLEPKPAPLQAVA